MRSVLAILLLSAPAMAQERTILNVYTYDSFVSEWGPGPSIEEAFEAECGCDLQFTAAGDGAALLAQLRLEGPRGEADVVVGLDTNLIAQAREADLFAPSGVEGGFDLPIAWSDDTFVPYDWGYFAFVYEGDMDPPANFPALAESDVSIIVQDPRSSTPGLGLLLWVQDAYGDKAQSIWEGLSDNIVTVTKGWSEAYGLFLEGEADMVLSYTTSPAYHSIVEGDETKHAAPFEEGHYLQIEVAAALASSDAPDLAAQFLSFLVSDAAQSVLPETNWMYPARTPEGGLPEGFETLVTPSQPLLIPPAEVPAAREAALDAWLSALGR